MRLSFLQRIHVIFDKAQISVFEQIVSGAISIVAPHYHRLRAPGMNRVSEDMLKLFYLLCTKSEFAQSSNISALGNIVQF